MKLYLLAIFIISDYFPPDYGLIPSGLCTIFLQTSDSFPPDYGLIPSGLCTIFLRTSDSFPPD